MEKRKYKAVIFFIGMLLAVNLAVLAFLALEDSLFSWKAEGDLEAIFFDVGQGDSALIRTEGGLRILVDGGPDGTVLHKLGKYLPFFDRRIDLIVLTHPHADHVTGLIGALERYDVERVVYNGLDYDTPNYQAWKDTVSREGASIHIARAGQKIDLGGGASLSVLYPFDGTDLSQFKDPNNTSVVLKLGIGEAELLLTGDIEKEAEEMLVERGVDLEAEVLKVGHQGSDSSTIPEFLEAVGPDYAVVSVGENDFGHPSPRVMKRLRRSGATVFRTDEDGDFSIIFIDGKLSAKTKR